jgi:hypothetical protein
MTLSEFDEWMQALEAASDDPEGVRYDSLWRIVSAKVDEMEAGEYIVCPAEHYADAIKWAAFWLALGAVLVALVLR